MSKTTETPATAAHVIADRRWPAHFTVDQMRAQLAHEADRCPAPFVGAVWNGLHFEAPRA